jgi:hypothetical protein
VKRSAEAPPEPLEVAIERLPMRTRLAMLAAVRCPRTPLIAGRYSVPGLGACPLLAAHTAAAGANAPSTFAGAFDRFTRTPTGEPRLVSGDERGALGELLLASIKREHERRAAELLGRRAPQATPAGASSPRAA